MRDEIFERSIASLHQAMLHGTVSSVSLIQNALDRIEKYDRSGPQLNAMLHVNARALDIAHERDQERRAGKIRGPLHGLPIVVKDNFLTADMPTTAGCQALMDMQSQEDAWQVQLLRQAGAVLIGKSTMHELACGITNASSRSGYTRNPYHPEHIPGGSSGGTAVAVAASMAVAGLGSDTSGSIRVPAACQNLYGLRPTWGLSSRTGMVPLCPSQDIGAPLARCVEDLVTMLDVTSQPDPRDPATWHVARRTRAERRTVFQQYSFRGLRLGVLQCFFGRAPHESAVSNQVEAALETMQSLGATLIPIDQSFDLEHLLPQSSLTPFEFREALAAFLTQHQAPVRSLSDILALGLHHPDVDRVLRLRDIPLLGREDEYQAVVLNRITLQQRIASVFAQHGLDAIAYPTLRCPPVRIGEAQPGENCALSPVLGWPALSIPVGFLESGLPVGVDLLAPAYQEPLLLGCAYHWQQSGCRRVAPPSTPPLV